ncbi:MAG: tRNA (guanosine(37)-N1)-methyltransferase TrmD, partial [Lachnospiraceae bacterium]|nr:tRNA (guanosine(37)-N1)-methyltransferase TrmD [Lachnospiraceae bacterium]
MNFHILTLFPEMVLDGLNTSIIGRAVSKNYISIDAVQIRDYTLDKHNKVDDYTYGGGAGMLMQAQPVYDCYKALCPNEDDRTRVIYLTPQGKVFDQQMAIDLAKEDHLIF